MKKQKETNKLYTRLRDIDYSDIADISSNGLEKPDKTTKHKFEAVVLHPDREGTEHYTF